MAKLAILVFGLLLFAAAIFYLLTPYDFKVSKGLDLGLGQDFQIIFGIMLLLVGFFALFGSFRLRV